MGGLVIPRILPRHACHSERGGKLCGLRVERRRIETIDPGLDKPDSKREKPQKEKRPRIVGKRNGLSGFCQSQTLTYKIKIKKHAIHGKQVKWKYKKQVAGGHGEPIEGQQKKRHVDQRIN